MNNAETLRMSRAERTSKLREEIAAYLDASNDYRGLRAVVKIRWEAVAATSAVCDLVTHADRLAYAADQHFEHWVLSMLARTARRQADGAVALYNDAVDRAEDLRRELLEHVTPPLMS